MAIGRVDLGGGYSYTRFATADEEWAGIILRCPHDGPAEWAGGSIPFEAANLAGRPSWHVENLEPLTLTPSISDPVCGCHGFIKAGKWVPA